MTMHMAMRRTAIIILLTYLLALQSEKSASSMGLVQNSYTCIHVRKEALSIKCA
jgi:hypothetical protein